MSREESVTDTVSDIMAPSEDAKQDYCRTSFRRRSDGDGTSTTVTAGVYHMGKNFTSDEPDCKTVEELYTSVHELQAQLALERQRNDALEKENRTLRWTLDAERQKTEFIKEDTSLTHPR